jgi:hypothetical protein
MKRLHTGIIVLDVIDIVCMSFFMGPMVAFTLEKYKNYRTIKITGEDIIVGELKKKFPINMFSVLFG